MLHLRAAERFGEQQPKESPVGDFVGQLDRDAAALGDFIARFADRLGKLARAREIFLCLGCAHSRIFLDDFSAKPAPNLYTAAACGWLDGESDGAERSSRLRRASPRVSSMAAYSFRLTPSSSADSASERCSDFGNFSATSPP